MKVYVVHPQAFQPERSLFSRENFKHLCRYLSEGCTAGGGEMQLADVLGQAALGDLTILAAEDDTETVCAAFAVRAVHYPRIKALRVILGAGERMDEWLQPLLDCVDEGARVMGASRVELLGRPGWEKALRGQAFKTYAFMTREVTPHEHGQRAKHHPKHQHVQHVQSVRTDH